MVISIKISARLGDWFLGGIPKFAYFEKLADLWSGFLFKREVHEVG